MIELESSKGCAELSLKFFKVSTPRLLDNFPPILILRGHEGEECRAARKRQLRALHRKKSFCVLYENNLQKKVPNIAANVRSVEIITKVCFQYLFFCVWHLHEGNVSHWN